jgi:glycosyltransferase involved in cell wall biosynthesis
MTSPRTTIRRLADRLFRRYTAGIESRLSELSAELRATRDQQSRIIEALRIISYEEPANRRRLYAMRRDPSYELAFKERDPLVSFVIPTYERPQSLRDVALPSILAQSYPNLEVIVVGDAAPPETAEAIAEIDDPRVTYFNRSFRGPYDEQGEPWLAPGTPPYNEGLFRARGRWIAPMADDDAVRPEHTRTLVDAAQRHGYEACYGRMLIHFGEDERHLELGDFPPRPGSWALQATIYHSGLSEFLHSELIDPVFDESNDWSKERRMMRLGVYIGMVEDVVTDKYERKRSFDDYGWIRPRAVS